MTPRFDKIIAGRPNWKKGGFLHFPHTEKHIRCADGVTISVQASEAHYCSPRNNWGPYYTVEVGFPSVSPPDNWKEYFDKDWETDDHTKSVYASVPTALVREFIESHGGEAIHVELKKLQYKHENTQVTLRLKYLEFACLCPIKAEPDYASVELAYEPDDWVVERESFSSYLGDFASRELLNEEVALVILRDFVKVIEPKGCMVIVKFSMKDNVTVEVTASCW